tara:strand:+ start:436 stop:1185 length:750 start_codon:yes stop_codon:yes gene_type:complete
MDVLISSFTKYNKILHACLRNYDQLSPKINIRVITDSNDRFVPKNINLEYNIHENDIGWLSSIMQLLKTYDEDDYVILCMDDLMPISYMGNENLNAYIKFAIDHKVDSLKLYEPPSQRIFSSIDSNFSSIRSCIQDKYPISTMFSIFKVLFLKELLKKSNDAWDFEQNASKRIKKNSACFTAPCNIFDFSNIVIKGKVVESRLKGNENEDEDFILNKMSKIDLIKHFIIITISTLRTFSLKKLFKFLFH